MPHTNNLVVDRMLPGYVFGTFWQWLNFQVCAELHLLIIRPRTPARMSWGIISCTLSLPSTDKSEEHLGALTSTDVISRTVEATRCVIVTSRHNRLALPLAIRGNRALVLLKPGP